MTTSNVARPVMALATLMGLLLPFSFGGSRHAIGTGAEAATATWFQDEPAARRIMLSIERSQRDGARLFSMDVTLSYGGTHTARRRMLGVTSGARGETHLLYVVTMPREFRGSALVVHDPVAGPRRSRIWMYLPGLAAFREIEAKSLSLLVPGTGFTFEDSRGWITTSRYRFRTVVAGDEEVTIEAVPNSDSLAGVIGSARVLVRVDPARRAVTGLVFYDRAGDVVRAYDAREFVQLAGRWLPARVTTEQRVQLLQAEIVYRWAELPKPPPADLFRPSVLPVPFLERLVGFRNRSGYSAAFPDSVPGP